MESCLERGFGANHQSKHGGIEENPAVNSRRKRRESQSDAHWDKPNFLHEKCRTTGILKKSQRYPCLWSHTFKILPEMVPFPPPGFPRIKQKWLSSSGAATVMEDIKLFRCADMVRRTNGVRAKRSMIGEALLVLQEAIIECIVKARRRLKRNVRTTRPVYWKTDDLSRSWTGPFPFLIWHLTFREKINVDASQEQPRLRNLRHEPTNSRMERVLQQPKRSERREEVGGQVGGHSFRHSSLIITTNRSRLWRWRHWDMTLRWCNGKYGPSIYIPYKW